MSENKDKAIYRLLDIIIKAILAGAFVIISQIIQIKEISISLYLATILLVICIPLCCLTIHNKYLQSLPIVVDFQISIFSFVLFFIALVFIFSSISPEIGLIFCASVGLCFLMAIYWGEVLFDREAHSEKVPGFKDFIQWLISLFPWNIRG